MTKLALRSLAAAVAIAAFLSTTPALAGAQTPDDGGAARTPRRDRGKRGNRGDMRERLAAELGLTQEQRDRIAQIRDADREALRAAHRALAEKRQALRDAMLADPGNQAAIDAQTTELNAARAEVQRRSLAMRQRLYQVLTPEQRERVRTTLRERRAARKDRLPKRL